MVAGDPPLQSRVASKPPTWGTGISCNAPETDVKLWPGWFQVARLHRGDQHALPSRDCAVSGTAGVQGPEPQATRAWSWIPLKPRPVMRTSRLLQDPGSDLRARPAGFRWRFASIVWSQSLPARAQVAAWKAKIMRIMGHYNLK